MKGRTKRIGRDNGGRKWWKGHDDDRDREQAVISGYRLVQSVKFSTAVPDQNSNKSDCN